MAAHLALGVTSTGSIELGTSDPTQLESQFWDSILGSLQHSRDQRHLERMVAYKPCDQARAANIRKWVTALAAGMCVVALIASCAGQQPVASLMPVPSLSVQPEPSLAPGSASAETTVPDAATPTPFPTLSPLSAQFVSPWYGYVVSYPAGWKVTPGKGPWPLGATLGHGNPRLDEIEGPINLADASPYAPKARFVAASIALPTGMTVDQFRAFASPDTCEALDPLPAPVVVDHVPALVSFNGCYSVADFLGRIWDLELVTGGRGYDITIDGKITADEAMAILDSVVFKPRAAR